MDPFSGDDYGGISLGGSYGYGYGYSDGYSDGDDDWSIWDSLAEGVGAGVSSALVTQLLGGNRRRGVRVVPRRDAGGLFPSRPRPLVDDQGRIVPPQLVDQIRQQQAGGNREVFGSNLPAGWTVADRTLVKDVDGNDAVVYAAYTPQNQKVTYNAGSRPVAFPGKGMIGAGGFVYGW